MVGLVLVGGEGTRLRPLTFDTPKPMLPILGRPMIARIVEWLARHGIERVVFGLAYRPDAFVAAFPDGKWAGTELSWATEPTPLDTAGAIRYAAEATGVVDEELVVCNGDVLSDLDLTALVGFHRRAGARATIAVAPVEDPSVYGVTVLDAHGRVLDFVEKPPAASAPSNLVNIGTYVLAPGLARTIPAGRRVSVEREVFPGLVETGGLFAYAGRPYWLDTGTPERYITAQLDILAGSNAGVELDLAEVTPGRFIGAGATIAGRLAGVCHIGARASVAEGARLLDAVVGDDAVIGPGAVIERSVLLDGAVVRAGATVSDSVLGPGACVGARAVVRAGSVVGAGHALDDDGLLDSARLPV